MKELTSRILSGQNHKHEDFGSEIPQENQNTATDTLHDLSNTLVDTEGELQPQSDTSEVPPIKRYISLETQAQIMDTYTKFNKYVAKKMYK